MKRFIECSVEKESIVGQGHYKASGQYIHIFTYDHSIAGFFDQLFDDKITVRRLMFSSEKGYASFRGPLKIIDFDGPDKEGKCNIYLKEISRTII